MKKKALVTVGIVVTLLSTEQANNCLTLAKNLQSFPHIANSNCSY